MGPGKLRVINGGLAFSTGKCPPVRLDPTKLNSLLCYGKVSVSQDAFRVLFDHDVQVAWLSACGHRCRGRLASNQEQTTQLRILQHRALADRGFVCQAAKRIVLAKIDSQLQAARHYQRHQSGTAASASIRRLGKSRRQAQGLADVDELRGCEGAASAAWFEVFATLLRPPWRFPGRVRRPPTDPVNALLSLGYTWLLNRTIARLQALGLEVNLGALHAFRPGRPSLACDLIEPLRAPVVDRSVLGLLNGKMFAADDFESHPSNGVKLRQSAFARVMGQWEQQWLEDGHERKLDRGIQQFISAIRRCQNPEDDWDMADPIGDTGTTT